MEHERKLGCKEISSLVIEYIDGELDSVTAELVKLHISECADCRKLYNDMRAVCSAAAESAYEAPCELHDRVMTAVRAEKLAKARRYGMKRISMYFGIGIAAMLCISVGASALFNYFSKNSKIYTIGANGAFEIKNDSGSSYASNSFIFNNSCLDKSYIYQADRAPKAETSSEEDFNDKNLSPDSTSSVEGKNSESSAETYTISETTYAACATCVPEFNYAASDKAANFVGEWTLTDTEGKRIVIVFSNVNDFTLTDTTGKVTAGTYEVSETIIIFRYNGITAEYRYYLNGSELVLTYLSGDGLIK
jgi:hypothetical protein